METIVFKFSLPTSAIMLNIGIVVFVAVIFVFSLFKTKGWQKTISLIIIGSLFVFFIFLFLIFPFTNAVKFDGENVVLNALPFGRKTIAIDSAEIVGIIDWTGRERLRADGKNQRSIYRSIQSGLVPTQKWLQGLHHDCKIGSLRHEIRGNILLDLSG